MRKAEKPITDTIQCLVCGKELHSLGGHLVVHGMTAAEYKEEFGVDHIVPPQMRKRISDGSPETLGEVFGIKISTDGSRANHRLREGLG